MSVMSFLGTVFSNFMNYRLNQINNAHNREIMQMQNTFNRQMQQEQNAYNDPTAQMARLIKAGINPALAYSNGVANTATSLPQAGGTIPMTAFQSDLSELGNRMSLDAQRNAEVDESTSRVKLNNANTLLVNKRTELTSEEITKVKAECNVLGEELNLMQARADNLRSDTALKNWQKQFNEKTENDQINKLANDVGLSAIELKYLSATLQERISGVQLLNSKQRAEIEKLRKENARYDEYMDATIAFVQANAAKTGVEFNLLDTFGKTEKAFQLVKTGIECLSELGLTQLFRGVAQSLLKDWWKGKKKGSILRFPD